MRQSQYELRLSIGQIEKHHIVHRVGQPDEVVFNKDTQRNGIFSDKDNQNSAAHAAVFARGTSEETGETYEIRELAHGEVVEVTDESGLRIPRMHVHTESTHKMVGVLNPPKP